jgi:hypothetical protein
MANLKPWYKVVTPREDLRESKPLDASEFAVHLDQVRDGRAPTVYRNADEFLDRTYLTRSLLELAGQVVRRLSGERTGTSAVFNLATQFGGGKTHALTLLYHLAKNGPKSHSWTGVRRILDEANVPSVPEAAVAVFVGTEFDSISGRGGDDGTPLRKTPWGEIAWQLGGEAGFAAVAEHDRQFVEPKGDVIQAFLPKDKPSLILMDEVINYTSTYRHKGQLCDEARKLLAWEDIQEEAAELKLEDLQRKQLAENQGKSKRDLRESVWRTYKTVMLLAKDNSIRSIDLGLVHSSADASLVGFIVNRLKQDGDISEGISPKFLVRNWSGAHKEWSTKAVKDAVFASPLFPRLLNGDLIRDTIARGVSNSVLAYVGKAAAGGYDPFVFGTSMSPQEVEISDDMYVITAETAEAYKQSLSKPPAPVGTGNLFDGDDGQPATSSGDATGTGSTETGRGEKTPPPPTSGKTASLRWSGEVPAQKWMNFYTKVLSRFATTKSLRLTVTVEVAPEGGVSKQAAEETKTALRELGLKDDANLS